MTTRARQSTPMHANGYEIRDRLGVHDSLPARRLASELPKDHPAIEALKVGGDDTDAVVKLVDEHDSRPALSFFTPDGWAIDKIVVTEQSGRVFVHLSRQEGRR
jgi:hypothetical protein